MWNIKEQILTASNNLGMQVSILTSEKKTEVISRVMNRFVKKDETHIFPIFEKLDDFVGIDVSESWMWISDFINDNTAILFFNDDDEKELYEFQKGKDIVSILNEIYNVEFYVTNSRTEYLLGYNHSQCLVASGTAIEWLENHKGYKERYNK